MFSSIHCRNRPAEILPGARFHFHEDERVVVAANDVDLATAASAKIAIKNFVAVPAQEMASQLFTEETASKMVR